jgi:chloramphenicol 3-O phosphotransferase
MLHFSGSVPAPVLFLNGTSSSGKTTLANSLQARLPQPWMVVSLDVYLNQLHDDVLIDNRKMCELIPSLLDGFNGSIAAVSRAGVPQIIDHVLQEPLWLAPCLQALQGIPVIFVKVDCPLDELKRREAARGDRRPGMAEYQFHRVHQNKQYDITVNTASMTTDECVEAIMNWMQAERIPTAFAQMRQDTEA